MQKLTVMKLKPVLKDCMPSSQQTDLAYSTGLGVHMGLTKLTVISNGCKLVTSTRNMQSCVESVGLLSICIMLLCI